MFFVTLDKIPLGYEHNDPRKHIFFPYMKALKMFLSYLCFPQENPSLFIRIKPSSVFERSHPKLGMPPDPIQGVIRGKEKGRGKGKGTDHYTLDGVGGIPTQNSTYIPTGSVFATHICPKPGIWVR